MGGVVSALGSIRLHLLSSLAPNLLLLPQHRQIQQQQQHNDNELTEIVVVDQEPTNLNFRSALLCFSKEEMGRIVLRSILSSLAPNLLLLLLPHNRHRQIQQHNDNELTKILGRIVSRLVASILSSLAPNLVILLPHHHQQQQRNNVSRERIDIVVVDQQPGQPSKTCLLEIAEGEDTICTINYGPRGMIPLAICHRMFLSNIDYPERLAIWNLTTSNKKDMIKTIPQSSVPRPPRVNYEIVQTYGFGFDPSSNDYKVIRFLKIEFFEDYGRTDKWLVELYSLKTNSWKQIAYPHGGDVVGYGSEHICVYLNGFWYTRASGARLVIIPFDLANDNFPPALIPAPSNTCRSRFKLVVFEGSQLAVIAYQCKPFEFELWVWNNDESWSLRGAWAIDGDPDIGYSPSAQFFKNDQVFLQNSKDELVLFDCAKQTLKVLGVYDGPFVYVNVFPFVENESSIK